MSIIDSNIRLTQNTKEIRSPAVAGLFYPNEPDELRQMLDNMLAGVAAKVPTPKAIIAPHAGYIYSGPVAASAYACLRSSRHTIKCVILLGPAHRVPVQGLALSTATVFSTPLGNINIDLDTIGKLSKFPQVKVIDSAHAEEHSLEVHLPFLQSVLDDFLLVPLVVGDASTKDIAEILEAVWGGRETLIVVSSDLSHYHDYKTAQKLDALTSSAILQYSRDDIGPHQACGCVPMRGLLEVAKQRNMTIEMLDLRNSGDTAGPHDRVVGYGAYALHLPQNIPVEYQCQLLDIARQSILQGFDTKRAMQADLENCEPLLLEKRAAFVTLKLNGQLRGCIGTTQAAIPLIQCITENAFNAAFHDPRFRPLSRNEFEQIDLSISVLSNPVTINFSSEKELIDLLRPGTDGLMIEKGVHKATFLPEVWENLTDPNEFLNQLKQKAGMNNTDIPDKAWRYTSDHFS